MLRSRLPWVLALLLVAAGCAEAAKRLFAAPIVVFRGAALESVGPLGGRARIKLLVQNPNPYSLSTTRMTYELFVRDSISLAHGADTLHRTIGGHDSLLVTLPLEVSWRGLSSAGSDVLTSGKVSYRLAGTITVSTPIGAREVPYDQKGRVESRE